MTKKARYVYWLHFPQNPSLITRTLQFYIDLCPTPASVTIRIYINLFFNICREGVMEFLLVNHPLDCPICDQGGECDLQVWKTNECFFLYCIKWTPHESCYYHPWSPPQAIYGKAGKLRIIVWKMQKIEKIFNSLCFSTGELRSLPKQWNYGPTLMSWRYQVYIQPFACSKSFKFKF